MKRAVSHKERGSNFQLCLSVYSIGILLLVALFTAGCETRNSVSDLREKNYLDDIIETRKTTSPLVSPITLEDAIRFALENNLDATVAAYEETLKLEAITGAKRKMLPSLMLNSVNSQRNSYDASKSVGLFTGNKGSEPSYSEPRDSTTISTNLTWNLIDFGIAYFRTQQAEDQAVIATQKLRRIRQNLCMQITEAYWDVQVARQGMMEAHKLLKDITARIEIIEKQLKDDQISKYDALKSETKLMESQVRLQRYRKEYDSAKTRLAALMGLPADFSFMLKDLDHNLVVDEEAIDYRPLEEEAVRNRPEMFQHDMEERIALDDARIALASMFPSVNMFLKYDRDANELLYKHNWYTAGLNASLDLLSIPQKKSRKRVAEKQALIFRKKRVALAVGIMAQLHLAGLSYSDAIDEYKTLKTLYDKRMQFIDVLKKIQESNGDVKEQEVIDAKSMAMSTKIKMLEAYAKIQKSHIRIVNTLGRDDLFATSSLSRNAEPAQAAIHTEAEAGHDNVAPWQDNVELVTKEIIIDNESGASTPTKSISVNNEPQPVMPGVMDSSSATVEIREPVVDEKRSAISETVVHHTTRAVIHETKSNPDSTELVVIPPLMENIQSPAKDDKKAQDGELPEADPKLGALDESEIPDEPDEFDIQQALKEVAREMPVQAAKPVIRRRVCLDPSKEGVSPEFVSEAFAKPRVKLDAKRELPKEKPLLSEVKVEDFGGVEGYRPLIDLQ